MGLSEIIITILALVAFYAVILFCLEVRAGRKRNKIADRIKLRKRRT